MCHPALLRSYGQADLFAWYNFLLTLASSGFYALYCSRHYSSCRYRAILDKPFLKEMGAFYSWNLFGSIAWLLKGAGINVVINLFSAYSSMPLRPWRPRSHPE